MQPLNQTKDGKTSVPEKTNTTRSYSKYANALKKVTRYGKELYRAKFRIFEEDRVTILKLLCWFLRDDAVADEEGLCLDKGILLSGPAGCGKSAMMKIINIICNRPWNFIIKPSQQIVLEFSADGYKVFDRYTVRSVCLHQNPRAVCFDDLGGERHHLSYGLHFNPLAEILLFRYEQMPGCPPSAYP